MTEQPAPKPHPPVTWRQILHFYTPLVLTTQLMTLSGPVINMAIGRAAEPRVEFAGYWIGFSIVLFIESACLIMQQLTATVVHGRDSLRRLMVSALAVGVLAMLTTLAVALTPIGGMVFQYLIPTTERVAELARIILIHLSPLPVLIAIRGIANGVAIRERRTSIVASATMVRLIALSAIVGVIVMMKTGSGAIAGAWALIAGITLETAFVSVATFPLWRARWRDRTPEATHTSYSEIIRIAAPLAVAAYVWTSIRPVLNAILGRLPDPELAQASFGVVLPILLVATSPLWTLHNVSLVLPANRADLKSVIRFSAVNAIVFAFAIGLLTLTPLKLVMLRLGFNLSPELEQVVAPALSIIALEPFFLSARSIAQGLMMKARRTEAFMYYSPVKIVLIAVLGLAVVTWRPDVNGALLAMALIIGGDLFDAVIYGFTARRLLQQGLVFGEEDGAEPVPPSVETA